MCAVRCWRDLQFIVLVSTGRKTASGTYATWITRYLVHVPCCPCLRLRSTPPWRPPAFIDLFGYAATHLFSRPCHSVKPQRDHHRVIVTDRINQQPPNTALSIEWQYHASRSQTSNTTEPRWLDRSSNKKTKYFPTFHSRDKRT